MGFKIYQGEVKDTNLLSTAGKRSVIRVGSGDKVSFELESPDPPSGGGGAKPAGQTADVAPVFVNEAGRDITVVWDATVGAQPQIAAPRTKQTTVATPGPGQWLVTPGKDNMSENRIDGADVMADVPKGWQAGSSVKFTTSRCGLDAYIVTYRFMQAGKPQFAHVIVSVRKRVTCHLFEMKRSAGSGDTDTIEDYRGPLREVRKLLADNFGIDLAFPNSPRDGTTAFHATRTKSQLFAMIPAAHAAGRPPRDLWINVVYGISGSEDGWGGQSQVHVEIKKSLEARKTYDDLQKSWQQFGRRGTKEDWARRFSPPLQGDLKKVAFQLADELITPDEMSSLNLRNILLHEIGHALGLVPSDGKAGGLVQDKWRDAGHQGHCGTKTCVMYWENGLARVSFAAELQKGAPFDHPREFDCMVYLFACDLSDLRKLPS